MLNGKTILITGGTGSFGRQLTKTIVERYEPRKLIIFSRDELKQYEMTQRHSPAKHPFLRFFLGDVRNHERLLEAFHGVDYVIHAAALKQVPACEYNPFEAVMTNVLGAQNVLRAAITQGVKRVVALSTDKAANPINLYGATKLCSDKLIVAANSMIGYYQTTFSVVRYGNVLGSRGSVIPFFLEKRSEGVLPVTDKRMTRFSITLPKAVDFVLECLENMHGGEVFVPKIPSYRINDVAAAIAPEAEINYIGVRPGEKMHELMVPEDEASQTLELEDRFIIQPNFGWWRKEEHLKQTGAKPCPDGFSYRSDNNDRWLSVDDLRAMVAEYCEAHDVEWKP